MTNGDSRAGNLFGLQMYIDRKRLLMGELCDFGKWVLSIVVKTSCIQQRSFCFTTQSSHGFTIAGRSPTMAHPFTVSKGLPTQGFPIGARHGSVLGLSQHHHQHHHVGSTPSVGRELLN
ncbi:hypothetical protein Tco_0598617 [Tanacetum coccineum]